MTRRAWLRWASERLHRAGVPDPDWDASLLLASALGLPSRAALFLDPALPVPDAAKDVFSRYVNERCLRRPLQYILGRQGFAGLDLLVDERVLVPRPETERLVEVVLDLLGGDDTRPGRQEPVLLADLGTGSGAIALALAHALPQAAVHATDVSAAALEVAGANARALGLANRVHFHLGDMGHPLEGAGLAGRFTAVACNPPYVSPGLRERLEPEVARFEPSVAVFTPTDDALSFYRRLAVEAPRLLAPDGLLAVETGHDQAVEVAALLVQAGWRQAEIHRDYAGHARVVTARRPHRPQPV